MLRILLENFRQGNGALGCPKVQWAFLGKNGCSYVTPVNVPLLTRTNFFTSALVADVVSMRTHRLFLRLSSSTHMNNKCAY